MTDTDKPEYIGWKEWLSLPALGIRAIKAKIDTGAKTSALHAFRIEPFTKDGDEFVRFWLHPAQKRTDIEVVCESPVVEQRSVRDSGGHMEQRYVISTTAQIGEYCWPIEITLTSREDMQFRMLMGRSAIVDGNYIVDPAKAYLTGEHLSSVYKDYIEELAE